MRATVAQRWIQRWDAQQERYIADREERFRVVGDVVGWALRDSGGAGLVVDLGCGPGSLGARLAATLPGVEVVGVDADPLLLGLAEAGSGVRVVRADLTDPGWPDALGFDGPWDAAVSSTALHWLAPDDLAALYAAVAARLRPGGVFVDADHRALDGPDATDLARHVRAARATRAGVDDNEDWRSWWDAALADADLAPLLEARSRDGAAHSAESDLTLGQQSALLREAGFATVTPVWQCGDDVVVVAVR
ncbi:class I SAM-dependent methyltransferase [Pseudonocardia humida]|uniref:Methyltransferase domain-containing protein n=1 Tax=Pseudonocardia humida TaxID=2800819 RepID=A0ABT0ZWK8_9PSEU|nr:class I SAM-dependent methyltransferase [Pseudonocardia humida]MCO1655123.1 methyltransferase domain-containing protein [Pseudonocardia humida]